MRQNVIDYNVGSFSCQRTLELRFVTGIPPIGRNDVVTAEVPNLMRVAVSPPINPQAIKQHWINPVFAAKARFVGRCFVARRFDRRAG